MNFPDIRSLVPHSGKMVLLDRVIAVDEKSLTTEVIIKSNSLFFSESGVGAWVGIEYMAQTIAAYAGYQAKLNNEAVKVGFLLGTRRYECSCDMFTLNSVLRINAQHILKTDNGLGSFECSIYDQDNKQLANATVTVFQPDDVNQFLTREVK